MALNIPWNTGQDRMYYMAWDANYLYFSYDGGVFTTLARTMVPTGTMDLTLDLGEQYGGREMNADFLAALWGTGTLTQAEKDAIWAITKRQPDWREI